MTQSPYADVVVRNAKVFTAADGASRATGFAIAGGRFVAVATEEGDELRPLIGPDTTVIDLAGAAVVPGLFDAHIHHVFGGRMLLRELHFSSLLALDRVLAEVDAWAAQTPAGAWVTGGSWGSTLLAEVSTIKARKRLDEVSHGHPVILSDDSHHNVWANTAALAAAGVPLDGSGELAEGTVTDPTTGEPVGLFMERATMAVRGAQMEAEKPTTDELIEFSLAAWRLLHSFGITGIQDALTDYESLKALHAMNTSGRLPGHVSCCLSMGGMLGGPRTDLEAFDQLARETHSAQLRTDFTKLALDGVPPTKTAGMLEAYLPDDEHGHDFHGLVYMEKDELAEVLRGYREAGRSTKIHCAGDRAVKVAIDAFEVMREEGSTLKYHIAHGQFVAPEDRARMADLDIIAEISPFIWYPGILPTAIAAVLPEQVASKMQPNRELTDLGVLVAGGSDWSVVPTPNAWEGIAGLVTRADPLGNFPGTLWPEQALTIEEALRVFSINGARAAGLDDVTGSVEAGKSADFAVLDRDPLQVEPAEIARTKVLKTWFAGTVVYDADAS